MFEIHVKPKTLATGLLAVALVACGGADTGETAPGSPSEGPSAEQAETAEATAAAEPTLPAGPAGETWCGDDPCPCEEGSISTFYGTDKMRQCTLAEPTEIQGHAVGANLLYFDKDGKLVQYIAARQQEIDGIPCEASQVQLHPNGNLRACMTTEDLEVKGYSCQGSQMVYLNEDGSFMGCRLTETATFDGITVPPRATAIVRDGSLYRTHAWGDPVEAGDLRCTGKAFFHPNGQPGQCELAEAATIGGTSYPEGERACMDAEGSVVECNALDWDQTI